MDAPGEDPLEDLARDMRLGDAAAEMRAEAMETELETYQGRRRNRSLEDVGRVLAHRGDLVLIQIGDRALQGEVVHVGTDYLTVETAHSVADIRIGAVVLKVVARPEGGRDLVRGSVTLKARLSEYEQTGEPVTLVLEDGEIDGRILVVAVDHVLVDDQTNDLYVPFTMIRAAVRPRPAR